ncbi:MAG: hypothetical protein HY811_04480 [Planctomycetes bacterium]|nr:hypothetical protein [Planctomycetota bacterium]
MKKQIWLIGMIMASLLAFLVRAEDSKPADTKLDYAKITELIKQLGDEDWETRDEASQKLNEIAAQILSGLRKLKEETDVLRAEKTNYNNISEKVSEKEKELADIKSRLDNLGQAIYSATQNDDPEVKTRARQIRDRFSLPPQPVIDALNCRIDFQFSEEITLKQLVEYIEKSLPVSENKPKVKFNVNEKFNLEQCLPIYYCPAKIPIKSALRDILKTMGWSYVVKNDAVYITTIEEVAESAYANTNIYELAYKTQAIVGLIEDEYKSEKKILNVLETAKENIIIDKAHTMTDLINYLVDKYDIMIYCEVETMETVDAATIKSFSIADKPLKESLKDALGRYELFYVVKEGALWICKLGKASSESQ